METPIELVANALYEMEYRHHGIQNGDDGCIFSSIFGIKRSIDDGCPVYITAVSDWNGTNSKPYVSWVIKGYDVHWEHKVKWECFLTINEGNGAEESYWYYPASLTKGSDYYYYNLKYITGIKAP